MDLFSKINLLPPDPIFGISEEFSQDKRKEKVNLSVGVYKNDEGITPVLSSVEKAEQILLESKRSKAYLPIEGDLMYQEEVSKLLFGNPLCEKLSTKLTTIQSLGGAGALSLAGDFIFHHLAKVIHIPDLTWPNHSGIFKQSNLIIEQYPCVIGQKNRVRFEEMISYFSNLPAGSVVLLHAGCHNPSGIDPTKEEWDILSDLFAKKKLIYLFDAAYLGFDHSFSEDAFPIRLFASKEVEGFVALSFSKNFALYGERVGALAIIANPDVQKAILSQCKSLVRRRYSNPPLHGAHIVTTILKDPSLKKLWEKELSAMNERINMMRSLLVKKLLEKTPIDFSYLLKNKGLFSFCNLTQEQVSHLKHKFGIYMPLDGRINIAGLNHKNLDYVVDAIATLWT